MSIMTEWLCLKAFQERHLLLYTYMHMRLTRTIETLPSTVSGPWLSIGIYHYRNRCIQIDSEQVVLSFRWTGHFHLDDLFLMLCVLRVYQWSTLCFVTTLQSHRLVFMNDQTSTQPRLNNVTACVSRSFCLHTLKNVIWIRCLVVLKMKQSCWSSLSIFLIFIA